MRYSLLSRFRGALLGSFVGESITNRGGIVRVGDKTAIASPHAEGDRAGKMLCNWSQIATCGSESLTRCGRLDVDDWVLECERTQPSLVLLKTTASSSEAVVATLPIALFFHDDRIQLRQQLQKATSMWLHDAEASDGALAVAFAIALALTEKLDVVTLIPQILEYLESDRTPLVQLLEEVQILVEQGAGLDKTLTQLRRTVQLSGEKSHRSYLSIALAFYCFLSTPEDFRLCVTRAIRTGSQCQIVAAIAGALAGAYNSIIGIPIGWRLAANQLDVTVKTLQQADRLLAVWSGFYDLSAVEQYPLMAVAAPRVIQPR
ncbi:MAG TPA: ADP-ribosylglycohydrolase family protein [Allocoleopsis sp.]